MQNESTHTNSIMTKYINYRTHYTTSDTNASNIWIDTFIHLNKGKITFILIKTKTRNSHLRLRSKENSNLLVCVQVNKL